jgi:hypothetical protein
MTRSCVHIADPFEFECCRRRSVCFALLACAGADPPRLGPAPPRIAFSITRLRFGLYPLHLPLALGRRLPLPPRPAPPRLPPPVVSRPPPPPAAPTPRLPTLCLRSCWLCREPSAMRAGTPCSTVCCHWLRWQWFRATTFITVLRAAACVCAHATPSLMRCAPSNWWCDDGSQDRMASRTCHLCLCRKCRWRAKAALRRFERCVCSWM